MREFISGLILGAGASRRLGEPKQLLPFRGATLLGWVIAQAERAAGLDEVVVVLGGAADEVRRRVETGHARVVENPVFGEGCASSYRAGIGALDPRSSAIVIILGDQPGVSPEVINRVAAEGRHGGGQIVLCSYRGRKGHPLLFRRALFDQLKGLHGDKAAWKLVAAHTDLTRELEFDLPFPEDIDTWEDFERLGAAGGAGREP